MYAPAMIRLWRALRSAPTTPAFVFIAFSLTGMVSYLIVVGGLGIIRGAGG